jgi:FMN phosphatase YigB (HAD superfamily)
MIGVPDDFKTNPTTPRSLSRTLTSDDWPLMPPRFLYFDLGNVLLYFDHQCAARQMAAVAGIAPEKVWDVVFDSGLELRYEAGELDDHEFHEIFCRETGTRPEPRALLHAGAAIFTPNASIVPVLAGLTAAGHRMGILSNTCSSHWEYCLKNYTLINQSFERYALSYEIGVCKPAAKIFERAAALAGVEPRQIFYVDDIAGHVAGARAVGFDAVQYLGTAPLVSEMRARGIEFNY